MLLSGYFSHLLLLQTEASSRVTADSSAFPQLTARLRQAYQGSTGAHAELPVAIARLLLKLERDKVFLCCVAAWMHCSLTKSTP